MFRISCSKFISLLIITTYCIDITTIFRLTIPHRVCLYFTDVPVSEIGHHKGLCSLIYRQYVMLRMKGSKLQDHCFSSLWPSNCQANHVHNSFLQLHLILDPVKISGIWTILNRFCSRKTTRVWTMVKQNNLKSETSNDIKINDETLNLQNNHIQQRKSK